MEIRLDYPFDGALISKKRRAIRRQLLEGGGPFLDKKIAVLGGSTTQDICDLLELFLLNNGIRPAFYQPEYGQYWQEAMFDNPPLEAFGPDLIFVHTSLRNLTQAPTPRSSPEQAAQLLEEEYARFEGMWQQLAQRYHCPIIQNNFEPPYYRLMGNRDASDPRGLTHFATALNEKFYTYAQNYPHFYIHDINRLAAEHGLLQWADPRFWHLYKYCLAPAAIPAFAFNLARIIRSLYGGNKKVLALDLDNTLWGGVVGDDGPEGLAIGHETAMGEVYSEFQAYLKAHKDLGVVLAVNSKNDEANALAGLCHPEGTLRPEDFAALCANWLPKDENIRQLAAELTLGADSFVFVDDNPAERAIVAGAGLGTAVPDMGQVQDYVRVLDQNGYFEVTALSADDLARGEMYLQNNQRRRQQAAFASYDDYLKSLEMKADIRPFEGLYLPRIAQLTNKSNQFNLTTRRYNEAELEALAADPNSLTLYGRLADRFGDNGVVTVVAARQQQETLHLELWLMSCRVLKRGMEDAMMDRLMALAAGRGVKRVVGYYYKTPKNAMVAEFYSGFGFEKISEAENGDSVWQLETAAYAPKNKWIEVDEG